MADSFLFNVILGYLYLITTPFTNLLLNYTAQSTQQVPIATILFKPGLFNIKDSQQGGWCFIETGFVAAGGGSRALQLCRCVSGGVRQQTSAVRGEQLSLFLTLPLPVHRVSVSPYTAICA